MGFRPRQLQVQILAVPLSGGCSLGWSQTWFGLPTYSFVDLLLTRAPLLRILHSTKWGECHRHSQLFLGYAERDGSSPVNGCAVFLLPLWPSHSLGFCLCLFLALQALLLLQYLLVSLLHIKALCSSNGKLVLKGAVSPSSETRVGTFHGTGKWKDRDGAKLFHWPSGNVLWPCSTSSMDTFPAIAVVSVPESHQPAAQLPPCRELRR